MTFVVDIDLPLGHRISARQDDDDDDNEIDDGKGKKGNKDGQGEIELGQQQDGEDFDESSEQADAPGGLVGLITNLSGVNALILLEIKQIY